MRNVAWASAAGPPIEAAEGPSRSFGELCARQQGAFSRSQAIAHGITDKVLARRSRVRQIQQIHRGVYAEFTGPLPWATRVWAAWLVYGPDAALTGATALQWYGVDGAAGDDRIHLALPHSHRAIQRPGILVTRHRGYETQLHGARTPPIVRLEVAALVRASADPSTSRQAALLLDVCRQRATTPERLLAELDLLTRLPARQVLRRIVLDAADGVQSFLERIYLRDVERAHALPPGRRQVRAASKDGSGVHVSYRDVEYVRYGLLVEIDGQAGHSDSASRWRDMHRDNISAISGKLTLRLGYQLVTEPCVAAAQVASALHRSGWSGTARACSPGCTAASIAV
ncbi:hypothetical protein GCM10009804_19140 [Kribbella hippodromi]|uniref:AbiEi antitoxin N-terminal domain-containing protein n=1 Tax=Kribbella hippodromi TaxID=434347 RepID=A0ABP4NJ09_9ACTN